MEYSTVIAFWKEERNAAILSRYLQSSVARDLTEEIEAKISSPAEERENRFLVEWMRTSRSFLGLVFAEIMNDIEKHSLKYPMRVFPQSVYCSQRGRKVHESLLAVFRSVPIVRGHFAPGKVLEPIPGVILPGVDYTAESLVFGKFLEKESFAIPKQDLVWMKKDARADYCYGAVCIGSEDFETLTEAWVYGRTQSMHDYIDSLDTIVEETLHGIADQIAKYPRYNDYEVRKEHYWMNEYGDFPEKAFMAIMKKGKPFIGSMKEVLKI